MVILSTRRVKILLIITSMQHHSGSRLTTAIGRNSSRTSFLKRTPPRRIWPFTRGLMVCWPWPTRMESNSRFIWPKTPITTTSFRCRNIIGRWSTIRLLRRRSLSLELTIRICPLSSLPIFSALTFAVKSPGPSGLLHTTSQRVTCSVVPSPICVTLFPTLPTWAVSVF